MAQPRLADVLGPLRALAPLALTLALACSEEPARPAAGAANRTAAVPATSLPAASVASALPTSVPPAPSPAPVEPAARDVEPAPTAPGQLRATAQSASEVSLAWTASVSPGGAVAYEIFRDDALVGRADEPRAVDGKLRPWRRYCYAVRAVDAAGRASPRSGVACAQTLDSSPPSPPAAVTASARPGNVAELAWSPSTDDVGVVGYEIDRDGIALGTVKGTAFRDEKLAAGREHCWTLRGLDAAGNRSSASDPACALVPDTTPPTPPGAVTAGAAGERAVDLRWEASQDDVGVVRYEIRRADAPVLAAAETTARDRGLAPAHRYCYGVRACDAAGNCSGWAADACATTPDLTPPTRPATLDALPRSDVAVELSWARSTDEVGVAGYEVRRGDAVVAAGLPDPSFVDKGLRPWTAYCYTVTALDAAGNRSPAAKACATTLDLTPPTPPGRPAAVSVSSSQLFVAWDPSADDVGVTGYEVLRDGAVIAKVTVTRMREMRLPANRKHCYSVRALDAAGNRSEAAGPACATTADPSELASPSDLRVVRVSANDVLLQWEPSEQAGVLYRIYANGTKSVGLTRGHTFNPSGRVGGKADCYRVAAVDDTGRESPRSNEICALLAPGPVSQR